MKIRLPAIFVTINKKKKGKRMKIGQLSRGIVNKGNWYRLKECMKRASRGEHITVGFLGGSITQGSLASQDSRCYAYLTCQWWRRTFPQAEISYVNAGIGGTSSLYGAARVVQDLLIYRPDVVVIDFTVNDEESEFFQETFEGVVHRIYQWETKPALVVLNNVYYDTGRSAQKYHNAVAAHYGIPCVSVKESIYEEVRAGRYQVSDLTPDGLHPNDKGHALVAEELIKLFNIINDEKNEPSPEPEEPEALTANTYQTAIRYQIDNCSPGLEGFLVDTDRKTGYYDHFKNGWKAKRAGDRIIFQIACSNLAVQYRKSVNHPVPAAKVTVDGKRAESIVLDGNFEETWGDCLFLQPVLHHAETMVHEIVIEVVEATEQDVEPFYLMSLICA